MKKRCIIVDDEPRSRDILKKYITEIQSLELIAECRDAIEASELLNRDLPDLLFLDINMPRISGISFVRSLPVSPRIIFTTAYPEYAVEGFEINAVDYLVKPFSFERFLKAVNRAFDQFNASGNNVQPEPSILVKSDKRIYSLKPASLLYIEGYGDYIRLFLANGEKLVVHDTIKNFINLLPSKDFLRIHKSYVLNLNHVQYIDGNQVHIEEKTLPVSPGYRNLLIDKLK